MKNQSYLISKIERYFSSYVITTLLLVLAFYLRILDLNTLGFWGDEYNPFWISEPFKTFNEISIRTNHAPTFIPPYYYYFLNVYFHIFEYSVVASKLFHIFFGIFCLLITFFISNFFLRKSSSNLVLYILSFNVFFIWISNEARIICFALFFQLLNIYIFFWFLKNINKDISIKKILVLILSNLIVLSIHPFSVVIVFSQFVFLTIFYKKIFNNNYKKLLIFLFCIAFSYVSYVIINFDYFFSSLSGSRQTHNQLNLNFFLGLNFKNYFQSYILGFFNLLFIYFLFIKIKKFFFKNLFVSYLLLIFAITYLFIILGTIFLSGFNSPRSFSYLLPIIVMLAIYFLTEFKKGFFSKIIIVFFLIYTPIVYISKIDKPNVRKPDTPKLIETFNTSNIQYIISENYFYFEHYLTEGYKKKFNKKILKEADIKNVKEDFWYLCLDLSWHQSKGSYYDEIYDCSPKLVKIQNFKKIESKKINGFVISKYQFIN